MPRGAKARTSCYERPSCFPRVLYGSLDGDNTNALRSSMGLEHDDATFKKYTTIMSKCAHECFFDSKVLSFGRQPPKRIELYMEKVNKALPILKKYDQSWPASAYVRIWIKGKIIAQRQYPRRPRTSSKVPLTRGAKKAKDNAISKHKHAARTSAQVIEVRDSSPAQSTSPVAGRNPERAFATAATPRASARNTALSRTMSIGGASTARSITAVSTNSNGRQATHTGRKTPYTRTTPTAAAAAAADGGASAGGSVAPVRAFLRSLTQPLDSLLPAFRTIGIRDAESLRSVVRMEGWYQWLYMVLMMDTRWEVTELQWKHLADGLKRLAAEERP
ncbi:uncharacterized protein TRAVEDRAFT_70786 [Trametes versicolor FP-101664 SS1]|uniref:uncharacterized protein n=1 Tax=Trametes versicolor (strain FP-101664) TaxID=717944 RepID=UPI000462285C|nr:uncharacterized protein TRAVEDRAFT_70786 [Trametes versicolor FP-101664 SS1]EIW60375.1 hypothetical protein TRAVEDRAFT_70786 [Trametes versicolor FP-101664 SS1]